MFIEIKVCGVSANALVDTGSTLSVLHPEKYFSIPAVKRPALQPTSGNLVMGDGGAVKPLGLITARVNIGNDVEVQHPLVIAEVEVPAVLGYDFLVEHKGTVDVGKQTLMLNDHHIPCQLESRLPSLFRVTVADTVSIPPHSEMMVPGLITIVQHGSASKA
jgi:hypothetical protein